MYTQKQQLVINALSQLNDDLEGGDNIELHDEIHDKINEELLPEWMALEGHWGVWEEKQWNKVYDLLVSYNLITE